MKDEVDDCSSQEDKQGNPADNQAVTDMFFLFSMTPTDVDDYKNNGGGGSDNF